MNDFGCACNGQTTQRATLGDLGTVGSLGACPGGATVLVQDTPIPSWVWLIAAVWGGLMLLKKK